ncbi:DNA polymerase III subunit epsilon [Amylibacter marinus]|uniref:DNA polymerase III subunit epsilon n=1 Tax=Amylibacter marinus TaxID=1475483 RepID=A0ABQ5VVS1_9RHOB|nr:DNA polymerase III subunit epsilon [Amylibacter marinus]GLQ35532.1 DNA polymerase III subunit epsilon [Amylibacter marinus]
MREIVWDTETTGFNAEGGDRLVEIGAVELEQHIPTGRTYHQYVNPERDMPQGAFEVHGLSIDFLKDYPVFAKIGQDFLDFIGDATLIAHNANFDMKFINAELGRAGLPLVPMNRSLDTLEIARKKFPGAQNSLDALCRRFGIDNSAREKHGALLDSEILAEVYLELVGGRQPDFALNVVAGRDAMANVAASQWQAAPRATPLPSKITAEEKSAHDEFITTLGDDPIWKKWDA